MLNIVKMLLEVKKVGEYVDGYIGIEDGTAYGRIAEVYFENIPIIEAEIAAILGTSKKSRGNNIYEFAFYNGERVGVYDRF